MTGDGATQSADGYYRILGRIDDVINVTGHRLGSKELKSAALHDRGGGRGGGGPGGGRDQGANSRALRLPEEGH